MKNQHYFLAITILWTLPLQEQWRHPLFQHSLDLFQSVKGAAVAPLILMQKVLVVSHGSDAATELPQCFQKCWHCPIGQGLGHCLLWWCSQEWSCSLCCRSFWDCIIAEGLGLGCCLRFFLQVLQSSGLIIQDELEVWREERQLPLAMVPAREWWMSKMNLG